MDWSSWLVIVFGDMWEKIFFWCLFIWIFYKKNWVFLKDILLKIYYEKEDGYFIDSLNLFFYDYVGICIKVFGRFLG